MPLATGSRVGNYEVQAPLGAGGMGEVYRARDPRLERTVAIKALSQSFALDPDRRARFEREARTLASLNHPNIAGIHGIEDVEGTPYLILEFVEGETLAQRLAQGPLSARETIEIAIQIASAIEAAHDRGVVHRDLKPANVMLTPARTAKVLDFGLAKGTDPLRDSAGPYVSAATMAPMATADGLILGTAAYMSPEQARGKAVDRRTDVWAFGCLLFECLTGHQAFEGETVSDVLARILEREPDWNTIPALVPARLRELTRRCLTKEAEERPRDIGDIRRELSSILQGMSSSGIHAAPADKPSLAVLYFENPANDPESDYFCSGITEDIVTDLSKIKNLRVASRNAVARYRGKPTDIPCIGSDLGVSAVLEGSVRRSGDRVRITAQLINAADGFQLWAERYDRTLADVFAVQEEIAHSIAEALRVALTPAETEQIIKDRPKDARAYDLYLRGREKYGLYNKEALLEALDLFREATNIDPQYALGWAGVADALGQLCQWQIGTDPQETARQGLEAARRAIAINPRLAEGYKAQALVLRFTGDTEAMAASLRKAIEVNPRFNPAIINLGVEAVRKAEIAAAERYFRRALEIDPQEMFATTWLSYLMFLTKRTGEGMELLERSIRSELPFYVNIGHSLKARVLELERDWMRFEQVMREARETGVGIANVRAMETVFAAAHGHRDEALRGLQELESVTGINASGLYMLADAALFLGEPERALGFVNRQLLMDLTPTLIRLDPSLHPLLDRPPFAPRRCDKTLVWPLEAPMMDARVHGLFREVKIDSGLPKASDVSHA